MSLCKDGLTTKLTSTIVSSVVSATEPLICLANTIDWQLLAKIVEPDLKITKRGLWWLGRKLYLRIHLAVMILQVILKKTDRGIERDLKQTPLYQVFCGFGIMPKWHGPDHTKIEKFRNRLTPSTHKAIADHVLKLAVALGFADPSWMDIDSTVQEANIAYPTDASLMLKLARKCVKVLRHLKSVGKCGIDKIAIDLAAISSKSKEYFFLAKNAATEKRRQVFSDYHRLVKSQLRTTIKVCQDLPDRDLESMPWHIRQASKQIASHGWRLLLDIAHFIRTHRIKRGKILSFHCLGVTCIRKGKVGKENEFGRVFQLGRIGGNFLIPFTSTDLRMGDKSSFIPALKQHADLFGQGCLRSVATDKGYSSKTNTTYCQTNGINADGIQRPANSKTPIAAELALPLRNRRAGIEPLIGHVKEFGLRKSRMKSDAATLASGYRSVTGFNLHQLVKKMGKTTAA